MATRTCRGCHRAVLCHALPLYLPYGSLHSFMFGLICTPHLKLHHFVRDTAAQYISRSLFLIGDGHRINLPFMTHRPKYFVYGNEHRQPGQTRNL